jgi:hypothetical protein
LRCGPVDVDAPLEERKVGGLGIHIVRNLCCECRVRKGARPQSPGHENAAATANEEREPWN